MTHDSPDEERSEDEVVEAPAVQSSVNEPTRGSDSSEREQLQL